MAKRMYQYGLATQTKPEGEHKELGHVGNSYHLPGDFYVDGATTLDEIFTKAEQTAKDVAEATGHELESFCVWDLHQCEEGEEVQPDPQIEPYMI